MKVDFTFISKDGHTPVHAVRWIPDHGRCRGVLQITHGMQEFIERYAPFAEYLTGQGYVVAGHDHIGHGQSVLSREDWGYFAPGRAGRILVQDMDQLRRITQKQYPGVPYFMLGHSMGSFLLRRYIASRGKGLAGAIIMGTGFTDPRIAKGGVSLTNLMASLLGWRHRSTFLTKMAISGSGRFDMTGKDPSNSWLTKDAGIAKWYYSQPACTFTFTLNGYRHLFDTVRMVCQQEFADRTPVNLPVLLVSGEDDPVGGYGKGVRRVFDLYKKAGIKDLNIKLYENDRHEILNETDRQNIYRDILDWMDHRSLS